MAAEQNKKRNTNSNRKTGASSGKRGRPKKVAGRKQTDHNTRGNKKPSVFRDEIVLIVTLVISLLLFFSNFNLSGKVGEAINSVTFGLIGFLAYLLPFFLFFGVAFYIANRGNKTAIGKLVCADLLVIVLSALIHLIFFDYNTEAKITDYYTSSADAKNGGGIVGGVVCRLLHPLFGTVGSYIVLLALMIIFLMFITGKTLFAYLGRKAHAFSQESIELMRERKLQREEEETADGSEEASGTKERRPARTVLLKKKDGTENQQAGGLFGHRKDNGKAARESSASKKKNGIDMEEIRSYDTDGIPIQRAGNNGEAGDDESRNKTYEDQLRVKFGADGEVSSDTGILHTPATEAGHAQTADTERSGLDEDIKKLLHAAGQDSMTEVHSKEQRSVTEHPAAGNTRDSDMEALSRNQAIQEKEYIFPPVELLSKPKSDSKGMSDKDLKETAIKLQKTLESFGVRVTITNVSCGPAVTRYELQPEQGVKVSRITGLADDIKLNLAAADVRIEAPIPGKAAVGIEVPNKDNTMVMFRDIIENKSFRNHPSDIAFAVGKDIGGQTIVTDIAKMPHLLIAGATGSGKSVCINTLIMSILYKAKPSDVRMIMVDPKVVELSVYNGIPHLLIPVVTDPKKASAALNWAVMEMTERYNKFAELGVRDIKGYNEKVAAVSDKNENYGKLPQIVIIVDELADLMMVAPGEVEDAICRLAQMARAAGLHLIIATQRPSVNVITGLIKANVPSRIAFAVSSSIDSRTIIDGSGAEKLLGKGDMLFFPSGYPKPIRVQGAFVSDKEVGAVVNFLTSKNGQTDYSEDIANKITNVQAAESTGASAANDRDDYFIEAGKFIIEKDKASIGMLQRVYKIGFNRAARIMDQLAEAGVVGPEEGTKPRKILMSLEEFEQYVDEYV